MLGLIHEHLGFTQQDLATWHSCYCAGCPCDRDCPKLRCDHRWRGRVVFGKPSCGIALHHRFRVGSHLCVQSVSFLATVSGLRFAIPIFCSLALVVCSGFAGIRIAHFLNDTFFHIPEKHAHPKPGRARRRGCGGRVGAVRVRCFSNAVSLGDSCSARIPKSGCLVSSSRSAC